MTVLSEAKLCDYLRRVLTLSGKVIEQIPERGTMQADRAMADEYVSLVNDLIRDKEHDMYLSDDSWNWIWESKGDISTIRLYGRLAWINLQLLELL